jgi:hypothetical protein
MTYAATEQTQTYNGWVNYETWLANLWLSNDEGSYALLMEATTLPDKVHWERGEWLRDILSEQLDDEIEEPCMWRDLLRHSFSQIDWTEIIMNNLEGAL